MCYLKSACLTVCPSTECFRSLRQDKTFGSEGEADRQEEEDEREDGQPQPVLQRVLCLPCGAGTTQGRYKYEYSKINVILQQKNIDLKKGMLPIV